jgi:hypothetical protein
LQARYVHPNPADGFCAAQTWRRTSEAGGRVQTVVIAAAGEGQFGIWFVLTLLIRRILRVQVEIEDDDDDDEDEEEGGKDEVTELCHPFLRI